MTLFKQNFSKNLILFLIILVIINLFGLVLINPAEAAYGLNPALKQVKTADNPTVYYLDHRLGLKKAYVSEEAFLSYNNQWSDVKIISSEELTKWPDLSLVKTKDSSQVFYISQGQKALIESEQQFIDYGFNWNEIAVISEIDLNGYKTADFDKVRASLAGEENLNVISRAGLLSASLQPLNLASLFMPSGSRENLVAAFRLRATDSEVKITGLTFTQQGVSSDEVIDSAYLIDESGVIYGDKYPLTNKHLYLNLAGQPIIIPANEAKVLYLKADLKPLSGVTGQTLKFGIFSAADISANRSVSAVFPLVGPEFRLADGVNNLGKVKATALTLIPNSGEISLGANSKAVASFRLAETSGNEDILIKKITLTNIGSAQDADLRNLVLTDQNGSLVMKAQTMVDRKINFIFEPGYLLKKNHYVDLTLKVNVLSGEGRDIKFVINSDSDISAVSKNNAYNLAVENSGPAGNVNRHQIVRAPIFLTAAAVKANELLLFRDQADAVVGSFELKNNVQDIKLSSLTLSIVKSSGAVSLDQPLVAYDAKTNAELGVIGVDKITNNFADISLGNILAEKGKILKIKFKTHIPDTAQNGDSYQVIIKSVNYRIAENNILYADKVELNGQKMEVIRPALYLYPGQKKIDDIAVAGVNKAKLGYFRIEATNQKDIRITSLTISNAPGATPINYANGFTNLTLYKGGSKVGAIIAEPNENSYTFDKLKIFIGAGASADFYVKADVAANAIGTVKLILESAVAEDYASKIPAEVNNKNIASPEVAITKTTIQAALLSNGSITRGVKNNLVASFSFTNNSGEKVKLTSVTINTSGMAGNISNNNGFSNLRFGYADAKNKIVSAGSRLTKPVADVNSINLGGFKLNPGETYNLNLYVDASANIPAGSISLFLRDIIAKGVTSGAAASISGLPTDAVEINVN